MAKLKFNKFGLAENPIGGHCTIEYQGRTLIGEVIGVVRSETRGMTQLRVRHFDGSPWPIEPAAAVVNMLERTYEAVR